MSDSLSKYYEIFPNYPQTNEISKNWIQQRNGKEISSFKTIKFNLLQETLNKIYNNKKNIESKEILFFTISK